MFGLILLAVTTSGFALPTGADCPSPLGDEAFRTRCTGKEVTLDGKRYQDCRKGEDPSLPIDSKIKTIIESLRCLWGDRVVFTSGYRDRQHNDYSWAYVVAKGGGRDVVAKESKHCRGLAVDFYVRGQDLAGHKKIAEAIQSQMQLLRSPLRGSRKAIWSKVYTSDEGRDPDNDHESPYVHVEIR